MKKEIFDECMKHYLSDFKLGETWKTLAIKFNARDGEYLRSEFKNERKRLGVPSKDQQNNISNVKNSNVPRVAVLDIETLPGIGYFFKIFDTNISVDQIIKDTCMLGWAGKFLNESKMYSDIMTSKEAIKRDTKRITESCWEFISQCNVIIGHNYSSFDSRYINTSFLMHNLPPLKYTIVDTLSVARQNMRFDSNKLAFINKKLGIREKLTNDGFPLWAACSEGDEEALKTMNNYCEGDIYSTEELFYKLRPYVKNFNVALYNEISEPICPVCGSDKLNDEGFYFTPAGKWQSVRCQRCQCISRRKTNLLSKDKRKSLLVNS